VFLKNLEKKIIEFDLGPQIHIQIIFTKYQKHAVASSLCTLNWSIVIIENYSII